MSAREPDASTRTETGSSHEAPEAGHPHRWWILSALCAALLLIVLDNTVLNVAIPAIAGAFTASTGLLQAVIDAYAVVFAGLLIAAGVASDRYGHRRTVLAGLLIFGVASAAAAAAWSVWWLIAMRAVMGVGAALVMPATLAVLVHVFPSDERPRAFAAWGMVAAVGMAAGPIVGGALVSAWSWAGVFLLNIPLVIVAALGVGRLVPEVRDTHPPRLDPSAAVLVTVGMLAITTALIALGEPGGNSPFVLAGAVIGVGALAGFGWRQQHCPEPMVELSLYRNRFFAAASTAAALLAIGTGSVLFVLLQYLEQVRGYPAWQAGLAIIPLAAGITVGSRIGGRAPSWIGARWSIAGGFTLTAAGLATLASLTPTSPYTIIAAGLGVAGFGNGVSSPATYSTVLGAVPSSRAGMGSALNDTHHQLGIALGVAALGSLLAATYRAALPAVVPDSARGSLADTLAYSSHSRAGADLADAARAAFTHAQTITLATAAGCALAGALIAATLLRPSMTPP